MDDPHSQGTFEGRPHPPDPPPGRWATVVLGLVLIGVGLWFFAERTLDLDLPRIDWGSLWPIALIGVGAWILLRGARRRR